MKIAKITGPGTPSAQRLIRRAPEIWEYPDSGKFGFIAEFTAADGGPSGAVPFFGREAQGTDYWDGE